MIAEKLTNSYFHKTNTFLFVKGKILFLDNFKKMMEKKCYKHYNDTLDEKEIV